MPDNPPSHYDIKQSLGYLISRLAREIECDLEAQLSQCNITRTGWTILCCIGHQCIHSPSDIASHLGLERSAVARLTTQLVKQSILQRDNHECDGRSVIFTLTESGQALLDKTTQYSLNTNARFTQNLSPQQQQQFAELITLALSGQPHG